MNLLNKLIDAAKQIEGYYDFLSDKIDISEDVIRDYEQKMDCVFPEDYKEYIRLCNGCNWPYQEVCYLNPDNPKDSMDILRTDNFEHNETGNPMPGYLIPFAPNGGGDYYCFSKKDDKIYFWQHDSGECSWNPDFEADSFAEWLKKMLLEIAKMEKIDVGL